MRCDVLPILAGALLLGIGAPLAARAVVKRSAGKASAGPAAALAPPPAADEPAPPASSPPVSGANLSTAVDAAKKISSLAGAGAAATAATIGAGILASAATGQVVSKVLGQGEGRGNLATVLGVSALPVAVGALVGQKLGKAIGLGAAGQRTTGHLAAAAMVAPPLAIAVGGAKLLQGAVKLISPKLAASASKALSALDPTRTNTVTGKVVGGVAKGVTSAAKAITKLGGLFKKKK